MVHTTGWAAIGDVVDVAVDVVLYRGRGQQPSFASTVRDSRRVVTRRKFKVHRDPYTDLPGPQLRADL